MNGFHASAAVCAGVAAGAIATAVEIALWWLHGDPLAATLARDARLAAAIVMGPAVLPPPATFDGAVVVAATIVHLALSIVYALALAAVMRRLSANASLAAGALFGVALYALNMYGFTAVFPWFAATRDPITLVAHVTFGVAVAAVYPLCRSVLRRRWS